MIAKTMGMRRRLAMLSCALMALAPLNAGADAGATPIPSIPATQDMAAPSWTRADMDELLRLIDGIGADGLNPADYDPAALRDAMAHGDTALAARLADASFDRLAMDMMRGHVPESHRLSWHIAGPEAGAPARRALRDAALRSHGVAAALTALLPTHPDYAALKTALAATPAADIATRQRLAANLERWRWMPRDLGRSYILVNVPAFTLDYVRDGQHVAHHRIIVGKPRTPTPQFRAMVSGVILNPSWSVPQSIIAESVGKLVRTNPRAARAKGYVTSYNGGRLQVRQVPGPGNALGQVKLVMPNPFTVYLHDTPSKSLFDKQVRAFSHGCIRTDKALDFTALLLSPLKEWDRAAIDRVLATRKTTRIDLPQAIPVYIGYFTATADGAGKVTQHPDIYDRDGPVIDALTDAAAFEEIAMEMDSGLSGCAAS